MIRQLLICKVHKRLVRICSKGAHTQTHTHTRPHTHKNVHCLLIFFFFRHILRSSLIWTNPSNIVTSALFWCRMELKPSISSKINLKKCKYFYIQKWFWPPFQHTLSFSSFYHPRSLFTDIHSFPAEKHEMILTSKWPSHLINHVLKTSLSYGLTASRDSCLITNITSN